MKMKKLIIRMLWLAVAAASFVSSVFSIKQTAHYYPQYKKEDISYLCAANKCYTEDEYRLIFMQTGLGKTAVDSIADKSSLLEFQKNFFADVKYKYSAATPVSFGERLCENESVSIAPLKNGDIFVSFNSIVFTWRCGHAGIVTSADSGQTLEAVVIGQNTMLQNIKKLKRYPSFMILRLKDADSKTSDEIAKKAISYMNDIPYNTLIGLYPSKYSDLAEVKGTQCAHLVWLVYASMGYDIDSNQGLIVTPNDISRSKLFDIVQLYGINPQFR